MLKLCVVPSPAWSCTVGSWRGPSPGHPGSPAASCSGPGSSGRASWWRSPPPGHGMAWYGRISSHLVLWLDRLLLRHAPPPAGSNCQLLFFSFTASGHAWCASALVCLMFRNSTLNELHYFPLWIGGGIFFTLQPLFKIISRGLRRRPFIHLTHL